MAGPIINTSGQTLADGTVQILATVTATKYLQFSINLSPMQSGDILKVRCWKKVHASGTLARFMVETYSGDMTVEPLSPVVDTGPFWIAQQFRVTIEQTAGTFRTFDWEILEP
jgi:hypothetical protein